MSQGKYCIDIFNYKRYSTSEVKIGNLELGAMHPIAVQSMTTTNTNDVTKTIEQIKAIADVGGQMVRMTTQGTKEAKSLEAIKKGLLEDGYDLPLVADTHFNTSAADVAALYVEKVRINPGNFMDGAKKFADIEYTVEGYQEELLKLKNKLIPFLRLCKQNNTAIRIGTNHGSLSDRIMSRYGDTPEGMVESCMEFLRICKDENFSDVVLSIKASNARIMVQTVRLLVQSMHEENMAYPLHLGVTEAGEGEDGRIRSAVGIGTLLADGIGDTIRVSLTEDPVAEIPVAKSITQYVKRLQDHKPIRLENTHYYSPFVYKKRQSKTVLNIGGHNLPVVIGEENNSGLNPDWLIGSPSENSGKQSILPYEEWEKLSTENKKNTYPIIDIEKFISTQKAKGQICFVSCLHSQLTDAFLEELKKNENIVLVLKTDHINNVADQRAAFLQLMNNNIKAPVIIHKQFKNVKDIQIKAACDFGPLLIDGFGDGVWMEVENKADININELLFSILQASRVRFSKPDYISCPGCGRTLFNLVETTAKLKSKTSHLKGLKIAVMGCIVNGPGEMADADYGYVGSGPGKITLYHQQKVVKRNIAEENAVDELISLIKQKGDWVED